MCGIVGYIGKIKQLLFCLKGCQNLNTEDMTVQVLLFTIIMNWKLLSQREN